MMQVREFSSFAQVNEYYTILSFLFYACICQWTKTVRIFIIILYVNSSTEET